MTHSSRPPRLQRGGTLIGFVAGMLVGLAIALSVAVYVTRVPVPFVDRGVSRSAAQDEAEAERNKGWNPNAGLASKAPLPAPAAPPAEAAPATPVAEGQTPTAPTASKPAESADPLGDLVQSRLGKPDAAAASSEAPAVKEAAAPAREPSIKDGAEAFTYAVQAGAFRNAEEAEAQRARLAMLGINASVTEREQNGRPVFRVRVGPFAQKAPAEATREQLEVNGVEAALVRIPR